MDSRDAHSASLPALGGGIDASTFAWMGRLEAMMWYFVILKMMGVKKLLEI